MVDKTCITIKPQAECPTNVPDGEMCLTVMNLTNKPIIVTQITPTTITPGCFTVGVSQTISVQVSITSAWRVTDAISGKIYRQSLSPRQTKYTEIIEDYVPAPALQCSNHSQSSDSIFYVLAAVFFLVGVVGHKWVDAKSQLTAEYLSCVPLSGADTCHSLFPPKKSSKTFLFIGIGLGILTILAHQLFRGALGKYLAKEPNYPINCQDCLNRGTGWQFTIPSVNDGVTGFTLWLRKMRCQFGGACMCYNAADRETCQHTSIDPRVPKGLQWQTQIANTDLNKLHPASSPSPSSSPQGFGNVCACCTSPKGNTCFDTRASDPPTRPCVSSFS